MIGTHDSFTYLPPIKSIFKPLAFLWRTQDKSIEEQKNLGVKYFDIRIRWDSNTFQWRVCHGIVDFMKTYNEIGEIIKEFRKYKVRLILERGTPMEEILFKRSCYQYYKNSTISFIVIKKDWKILVNKDPQIVDYTYIPWYSNLSFFENIKRLNFFSTIKRWANGHNPKITPSLLKEPTIHFIDYI